MNVRRGLVAAVGAIALVAMGCGASPQAQLQGAVYAAKAAPVYRHSTYEDAMGGHEEDESGAVVSQSQSWFFNTTDPMPQVEGWYDQNFPNATKKVEEDGDGRYVTYTLVPTGAEQGEQVEVVLRPGKIQICEECKPGKIKSS